MSAPHEQSRRFIRLRRMDAEIAKPGTRSKSGESKRSADKKRSFLNGNYLAPDQIAPSSARTS